MPTPLAARMPRLNWLSLTPSSAAFWNQRAADVIVGRAVGAHRVEHRQIVHGAGVTLLGRHLVPGLGLGDVAVDAETLLVEIADAVLRRGKAEVGGLLVPFGGGLHVGLAAASFGVAGADFEQRLGIAGFGCFAQRQRAGIIRHGLDGDAGRRRRFGRRGNAGCHRGRRFVGRRRRLLGWRRRRGRSSAAASSCGAAVMPALAVSTALSSDVAISGAACISG